MNPAIVVAAVSCYYELSEVMNELARLLPSSTPVVALTLMQGCMVDGMWMRGSPAGGAGAEESMGEGLGRILALQGFHDDDGVDRALQAMQFQRPCHI